MLIIWGFGKKTVKDIGSCGVMRCPHCNNEKEMHKLKVTTWFTLFFIPTIPYKMEYVIMCPICEHGIKVSKDEIYSEAYESTASDSRYHGKNEVQANFLRQMDEANRERDRY